MFLTLNLQVSVGDYERDEYKDGRKTSAGSIQNVIDIIIFQFCTFFGSNNYTFVQGWAIWQIYYYYIFFECFTNSILVNQAYLYIKDA